MAVSQTSFLPDNEAHLTHGAYGYLRRVKLDKPLSEHMHAAERSILADFTAHGPRGMLEQNALMFQAAAMLLWQAMLTGPEAFEKLAPRWGWLAGNAARIWRELATLPQADHAEDAREILSSYHEVTDDDTPA